MPKTARNAACPCGSGKKYKHCCLDKDRAGELAALAARRTEPQAQHADQARQAHDERAQWLASQALEAASNAVVDLVQVGRLDEAERAAHELLRRYPEVHDGYDRLGMVYEARGQLREAAQCYRKVIEFARANPEDYAPGFETTFLALIARLDAAAPEH